MPSRNTKTCRASRPTTASPTTFSKRFSPGRIRAPDPSGCTCRQLRPVPPNATGLHANLPPPLRPDILSLSRSSTRNPPFMTIEFHCPHCDKLLKTADDKAGVSAKCPGCGESVLVPAITESNALFDQSFSPPPLTPAAARRTPASAESADENTDAAAMRDCPMCGERIKAAATKCRYCGEELANRRFVGSGLASHR